MGKIVIYVFFELIVIMNFCYKDYVIVLFNFFFICWIILVCVKFCVGKCWILLLLIKKINDFEKVVMILGGKFFNCFW